MDLLAADLPYIDVSDDDSLPTPAPPMSLPCQTVGAPLERGARFTKRGTFQSSNITNYNFFLMEI